MSNAVFPSLPGLSWGVQRTPEFTTVIQQAPTKREVRVSLSAYPLYAFTLSYEFLREAGSFDELRTLCGFFLQRRGAFDSFLYSDPTDNAVVDEQFGTADGVQTTFQLTRSFGGFAEPVQNVNTLTNIKINGVVQSSGYSVSGTGLVTFTSAPASGAITWSGSFFYRCRFLDDSAEFEAFMKDLYELKKIQFIGATGNKVGG